MHFISKPVAIPSRRLADGTENQEYEQYITNDAIVLSRIKATVSASIQLLIIPYTTAYEAWRILEEVVSPIDTNHIHVLTNQMASLKKTSTISMKDYILKFKALKNSLGAIGYNMTDNRG